MPIFHENACSINSLVFMSKVVYVKHVGPSTTQSPFHSSTRVCVFFVVYCKPFTKDEHSIDSNASHIMRVCVSVVVYCKPFTKEEHSIDRKASLYHACVCFFCSACVATGCRRSRQGHRRGYNGKRTPAECRPHFHPVCRLAARSP